MRFDEVITPNDKNNRSRPQKEAGTCYSVPSASTLIFADVGSHLAVLYLENKRDLVCNETLRPLKEGLIPSAQFLAGGQEGPLSAGDTDHQADQLPQITGFHNGLKAGQAGLAVFDPREGVIFDGQDQLV